MMNDARRLILQSFMSRGILTEAELKEVHNHAHDHFGVEKTASERCLKDINTNITPMSMEIRTGKDEITGSTVYALVRTTESDLGRLSTDYPEKELEFFKKMLDLIVESDAGVASSTDILNLTNEIERLSKENAEKVLQSLVKDKWLVETQGDISLSSRAILELEHYLKDVYGEEDIKDCNICKKIVLRGSVCYECHIRIHFYCVRRFFKDQTHIVCPQCKKPWTDEFPNTDDEEEPAPPVNQSSSSSRKRRDRRS